MENTGVTLHFVLKILRKLAAGGVIQPYKGVSGGGYELAREPENITPPEGRRPTLQPCRYCSERIPNEHHDLIRTWEKVMDIPGTPGWRSCEFEIALDVLEAP